MSERVEGQTAPWTRMDLTPDWRVTGPGWHDCELASGKFTVALSNDSERGEGELEITEVPMPPWPDIARAMAAEYECDVYVHMPDGFDPAVCCFERNRREQT